MTATFPENRIFLKDVIRKQPHFPYLVKTGDILSSFPGIPEEPEGRELFLVEELEIKYGRIKVQPVCEEKPQAGKSCDYENEYRNKNLSNNEYYIPLGYMGNLNIVPQPGSKLTYSVISQVIAERPRYVMSRESKITSPPRKMTTGSLSHLPANTVVEVNDILQPEGSSVQYLKCVDGKGACYVFNQNTRIDFIAVQDKNEYTLQDVYDFDFLLPTTVKFKPSLASSRRAVVMSHDRLAKDTLIVLNGNVEILEIVPIRLLVGKVRHKEARSFRTLLIPHTAYSTVRVRPVVFRSNVDEARYIQYRYGGCLVNGNFILDSLYLLPTDEQRVCWLRTPYSASNRPCYRDSNSSSDTGSDAGNDESSENSDYEPVTPRYEGRNLLTLQPRQKDVDEHVTAKESTFAEANACLPDSPDVIHPSVSYDTEEKNRQIRVIEKAKLGFKYFDVELKTRFKDGSNGDEKWTPVPLECNIEEEQENDECTDTSPIDTHLTEESVTYSDRQKIEKKIKNPDIVKKIKERAMLGFNRVHDELKGFFTVERRVPKRVKNTYRRSKSEQQQTQLTKHKEPAATKYKTANKQYKRISSAERPLPKVPVIEPEGDSDNIYDYANVSDLGNPQQPAHRQSHNTGSLVLKKTQQKPLISDSETGILCKPSKDLPQRENTYISMNRCSAFQTAPDPSTKPRGGENSYISRDATPTLETIPLPLQKAYTSPYTNPTVSSRQSLDSCKYISLGVSDPKYENTRGSEHRNVDFSAYTVEDTVECFNMCGLEGLAKVCETEKLDGYFMMTLDEHSLKEEPFCLNFLQIKKVKIILNEGWRPKHSVA